MEFSNGARRCFASDPLTPAISRRERGSREAVGEGAVPMAC